MAGEATKPSWWQTLPGLMTATAGCISAITALIIALNQAGVFKSRDAVANGLPVAANTSTGSKSIEPPTSRDAAATSTAPNHSQQTTAQTGEPDVAADAAVTKRLGALTDTALLEELERANISDSVGKGAMLSWLADDDRTYRRIARATARLLNGKRLVGKAPDLDVIKFHYLQSIGLEGGGVLPVDLNVNDAKLRLAIIAAFNDKNGTSARRMDGIVEPR